MKSHRIALFAALSAVVISPLGLLACATADLIEAPAIDAGPSTVVSESGTASDAADAADAGNATDASDAGDARTDAGATDASDAGADAPSQG